MFLRIFRILSVLLLMTMPSSTRSVQEAVTFERPFLTSSTMQRRQAPMSWMPGMWQRWGMQTPT